MPDTLQLRETTAARLSEAAVDQNGHALLRLIGPGWSANGRYYSENLLKRDGLKVFKEGVQTYLNHPSATEKEDRPERSVRDLVGALTENSYYDPKGPVGPGVYAKASVRQGYKPIVKDLAEVIGMSIRADGTGHEGTAEGREGLIVDSIESVKSVDYVTKPAAGGRVVELLESVQNPDRGIDPQVVVDAAIAHGISEATANETREALSAAVREEYSSREREYAWVRDFDDTTVWFHRETPDQSGTFAQGYSLDDNMQAALSGDPVEVRIETRYVPITTEEAVTESAPADPPAATTDVPGDPPGQTADPSAPTDVTESTSEEDTMTDTPGAGTAPTPLSTFRQQISNELEHERNRAAMSEARERARAVLSARLAEEAISPAAAHRITESCLVNLPLTTDQRQLDEAALLTRIAEHVDQSILEATEVLSAAGLGRPRDLGFQESMAGGVFVGGEQHTAQIKERFISLGLSESAAETAAKGRA